MRLTGAREWLARPLGRIAQMAAAFAASELLRGAIRFATSVVVARRLGPTLFGRLTLYLAWASALTAAFDLGLRVLLTRESARRPQEMGAAVAGAIALRLSLFLPVALFLWVGAPAVASVGTPIAMLRAIAMLAAAGAVYGCVAAIHHATPARLGAILAIESVGSALECAGAIAVVAAAGGIADLLHLSAAVQVAQFGGAVLLWRAVAPSDRLDRPSLASMRALLARALPFAGSGLVANAQARLAPILLGAVAAPPELAAFGVASRLEGLARRLPSAAFGAALPVFAGAGAGGDASAARRRFDVAVRAFGAGAAVTLCAGAAPMVNIAYGTAFAAAVWPLRIAAVGLAPFLVNSGRKVRLYADGRERIALRWSTVTLVVQAAGCALLIPRFGAAGAAAALAAGELCVWYPLRLAAARADEVANGPPLTAAGLVRT